MQATITRAKRLWLSISFGSSSSSWAAALSSASYHARNSRQKCQIRQTDNQNYVVCYARIVTAFFWFLVFGWQQLYLVKIPKGKYIRKYIVAHFWQAKNEPAQYLFSFPNFSSSSFVLLSHFDFSHFTWWQIVLIYF